MAPIMAVHISVTQLFLNIKISKENEFLGILKFWESVNEEKVCYMKLLMVGKCYGFDISKLELQVILEQMW